MVYTSIIFVSLSRPDLSVAAFFNTIMKQNTYPQNENIFVTPSKISKFEALLALPYSLLDVPII